LQIKVYPVFRILHIQKVFYTFFIHLDNYFKFYLTHNSHLSSLQRKKIFKILITSANLGVFSTVPFGNIQCLVAATLVIKVTLFVHFLIFRTVLTFFVFVFTPSLCPYPCLCPLLFFSLTRSLFLALDLTTILVFTCNIINCPATFSAYTIFSHFTFNRNV